MAWLRDRGVSVAKQRGRRPPESTIEAHRWRSCDGDSPPAGRAPPCAVPTLTCAMRSGSQLAAVRIVADRRGRAFGIPDGATAQQASLRVLRVLGLMAGSVH